MNRIPRIRFIRIFFSVENVHKTVRHETKRTVTDYHIEKKGSILASPRQPTGVNLPKWYWRLRELLIAPQPAEKAQLENDEALTT